MLFDAAALCWKSSGCCKDFKFMCQEEQEGTTANGYQTNVLTKSYRGIQVCSFCTTRKVWWMSANTNTTNCVGINFVSPRQGHLGKMCRHLAVAATCRQHVADFLNSWSKPISSCSGIIPLDLFLGKILSEHAPHCVPRRQYNKIYFRELFLATGLSQKFKKPSEKVPENICSCAQRATHSQFNIRGIGDLILGELPPHC